MQNPYRALPSIDRLLRHPALTAARDRFPADHLTRHARAALDRARAALASAPAAPPPDDDALAAAVVATAEAAAAAPLRPLINATGVILHTNLGRAPLSAATRAAMARAGQGYSNLEFDLAAGERGSRFVHLDPLLREVTGAEAGIIVNNNAAAVLLALAALAPAREVLVSRGEAVEIGGGFRIPDVLRQSGATLVEVGTTNRTRAADYRDAATARTAVLLRVHASNFRIVGFTEAPTLAELRAVADEAGLLLLDDLGSGALLDTTAYGLAAEPRVQDSVRAGADVVLFSGDKLLGGPQAGIIVGGRAPLERLQRHPLARALRADKTAIAGLAATLQHYLRGEAEREIPVWRMISAHPDALRQRAAAWRDALAHPALTVREARSTVGGGSLPGETLPTWALAIAGGATAGGAMAGDAMAGGATDVGRLAQSLRCADPPVVGRIEKDTLWLDPRTVDPEEDAALITALRTALAAQA